MKKYVLVPFLLLVAQFLSAQISISQDTMIMAVPTGEYEVIGHATVTNNIPQLKTYRWVRSEVSITQGWRTAVCDLNQCYTPFVDSMQFQIGPGASGLLDVHLYPDNIFPGYALVEMLVKDINNPSNHVVGIYIFDSSLTGLNEVQLGQFKVYPNPSYGLFRIDGMNEKAEILEVWTPAGQRVARLSTSNQNWYDLGAIPAGTYVLRLFDVSGVPMGAKLVTRL